ncbi:MAG: hypothetical protein A2152_03445 [Candidatus Levybacteria bacterium RBG_16_35_6]|nr:MAG: hypothetical protein A2152_03445 [Candidatus Levybacteria bacterium RBG_16_35_6]
MKDKFKKISKGFTLIELVIVVAVLGIISTIVMTSINPMAQFQKANDGRIKSDLAQLQRVLESYYEDVGRYPASPDYEIQTIADPSTGNAWGDPWSPYMDFLPKSPGYPNRTYVYYSPDGQTYYLYANLERGTIDPKACNGGNRCDNAPADANCGGTGCNYGVSSPNVNP